MIQRKYFFLIGVVMLIFVIGGVLYWQIYQRSTRISSQVGNEERAHQENCLTDDEITDYPINPKYAKEVKAPLTPLIISVRDKATQKEKFSFQVGGINPDHYHPLELHKCGVYVLRKFNYDLTKSIQAPGYREELWRYNYNGHEESIFLFAEKDALGVYKAEFNNDFRIDPDEKYLALERGYFGKDNYALVIKDINTLNDLLALNLKDILRQHPDIIPGNFELGIWTEDGKYLQGMIFQGALDTAYYRIERNSWKTEVLPTSPDILAGVERAINFEKMYLAYVDIPTFTGFQEVYEQIIERAKKEGRQKNLYVYNLKAKEKIKVASADPEWRFDIKWLSDTELQYELPSGEEKIYKLNEK